MWSDTVERWMEAHKEEQISFLQKLIQIPSVTRNEGPIQAFIQDYVREMGLEVDCFVPDLEALRTHPTFVELTQGYEGRPNVMATLRGGGGEIPSLQRPQ